MDFIYIKLKEISNDLQERCNDSDCTELRRTLF